MCVREWLIFSKGLWESFQGEKKRNCIIIKMLREKCFSISLSNSAELLLVLVVFFMVPFLGLQASEPQKANSAAQRWPSSAWAKMKCDISFCVPFRDSSESFAKTLQTMSRRKGEIRWNVEEKKLENSAEAYWTRTYLHDQLPKIALRGCHIYYTCNAKKVYKHFRWCIETERQIFPRNHKYKTTCTFPTGILSPRQYRSDTSP